MNDGPEMGSKRIKLDNWINMDKIDLIATHSQGCVWQLEKAGI